MTNTITTPTGSYTNDPWTINSDVYNTNGLQYGTVSNQTVTYDPLHPNVGAQFSWNFPTEPANAILIHSYPSVTYGAGPWGVSTPLSGLTQTINQQSSLDVKYNVSTHGNTAGYDVAFDVWLTTAPNGGAAAVTTEVMVWLHSGSFAPVGTKVGNYSDSTYSGSIYDYSNMAGGSIPHPWNYVAFAPTSDNLSGDIDLLSMLKKAESLGLITGDEYISGIQLGAEVAYGSGGLTINDLEISQNGSGNYATFDQSTYTGTTKSDDIFLYGQAHAPTSASAPTTHDATYDTTVSFTLTGTIIGGHAPQAHIFVNGADLGAIQLTPTAGAYVDSSGVTWSAPQSFVVSVPGVVDISELKLVLEDPVGSSGPENMMISVLRASVDGVPLSGAEYHLANGTVAQQQIGSTASQYDGGYTLFDASSWNTYSHANDTGSAAHPITVVGGGGDDTLHVLGTPDEYSISALPGGGYSLSEHSGLNQNAVLQGISHIAFQDGETLDTAAWATAQATPSLAIASAVISHAEGSSGTTAFDFTVTRSGDLDAASTASWSVAGSGAHPANGADFAGGALPTGTVSFAAGQATATVTVHVAADTTVESDEGFTVTLSNPAGVTIANATGTGLIVNDDSAPANPPPADPPPSSPPPASGGGGGGSSGASSAPATGGSTSSPTVMHDIAMDGSASNDAITAMGGDSIRGLDGNDTISSFGAGNQINGNQGADLITGGPGTDTLYGGQGNDTITGGTGQSILNGNIGDDIIHGGDGGNTLYGGQGDDTVYGGAGADTLSGDLGNDILYGGAGADHFMFRPGSGQDWIADFHQAEGDRVVLPTGTAYTITSFDNQVVIDLGHGDTIGLAGVSPAQLPTNASDWLSFA